MPHRPVRLLLLACLAVAAAAAERQQPINTIDPVTGRAVDPALPAVLVPQMVAPPPGGDPYQTVGSATPGRVPTGGVQPAQQVGTEQVAIAISDRSSAEIIRANPQIYLPAARRNVRFDEVVRAPAVPGQWQHGTDTSGTTSTGLDNAAHGGAGLGDTGRTRSDSTVPQGSGYPRPAQPRPAQR